jgi:plasmid addiction system poison protein
MEKALTGNLKGLWRYKIMDYSLIVDIQDKKLIIVAIDFEYRSKIYL